MSIASQGLLLFPPQSSQNPIPGAIFRFTILTFATLQWRVDLQESLHRTQHGLAVSNKDLLKIA